MTDSLELFHNTNSQKNVDHKSENFIGVKLALEMSMSKTCRIILLLIIDGCFLKIILIVMVLEEV